MAEWGQGPALGEGQCLTTVSVVPPAGQGGACLPADDGISTENLAAQLLLLFGVPGNTQIKHTVSRGAAGTVEGCQRWEEEARTPSSEE